MIDYAIENQSQNQNQSQKDMHTAIEHKMNLLTFTNFDINDLYKSKVFSIIFKEYDNITINYILDNSNFKILDPQDRNKIILKICKLSSDQTILSSMINMLSDINYKSKKGWSILHHLCAKHPKQYQAIKYAIDKNIDIMARTTNGCCAFDLLWKPFYKTHFYYHVSCDIFKLFEQYVVSKTNINRILYKIVKNKNSTGVVNYIIKKYDINFDQPIKSYPKYKPDKYLINQLCWSLEFPKLEKIIDTQNIDINKYSVVDDHISFIICKKYSYDINIINYFAARNLNFNQINSSGDSCLNIICRISTNYQVIKYFIDHFVKNKLNINKTNIYSYNPFMYLCMNVDHDAKYDALLYLIKNGCYTSPTSIAPNNNPITLIKKRGLPKDKENHIIDIINKKNDHDIKKQQFTKLIIFIAIAIIIINNIYYYYLIM